jgi:FlaA1/EpsC-like NDP-sugar epimerase
MQMCTNFCISKSGNYFAKKISNIFLALPSLKRHERNAVMEKFNHLKVSVRTLPGLVDLAQGKVQVSDLRELDVEDLLDRSAVGVDDGLIPSYLINQVVMVSGAGGSVGSELCRQIIQLQPSTLVLIDHSEIALYEIHRELLKKVKALTFLGKPSVRLLPILGSVTDEQLIEKTIITHRPHVIYHAAAYKHVPMVELNPFIGIKNNTLGTLNLAKLASKLEVPYFVLISTDKAVNPTNIMGASKRLAEMVLQAIADLQTKTIFTMVRFGNVLASSGSVIPMFREQIKNGGPVTVTDFRMTRYFMTISEAAQLVIHAGAMAKGGEVFLLDMGKPVRILDLAKKMIELSGLEIRDQNNPDGEIEIIEIGLRPGEKLYEELLISGQPSSTSHSRIFKADEEYLPWNRMHDQFLMLNTILNANDRDALVLFLSEIIPGYSAKEIDESLR